MKLDIDHCGDGLDMYWTTMQYSQYSFPWYPFCRKESNPCLQVQTLFALSALKDKYTPSYYSRIDSMIINSHNSNPHHNSDLSMLHSCLFWSSLVTWWFSTSVHHCSSLWWQHLATIPEVASLWPFFNNTYAR